MRFCATTSKVPCYVLSQDGISVSPDKVKAVKEYPVPKNVTVVRAFLGLASFYRKLVPDFAKLAKPLTSLTRKSQIFVWRPIQQEAFENLKTRLCTMPVLSYPDFNRIFTLTTDACGIAVAAVLSQIQDGVERPLAYASRQLNKDESAYCVSELELLALVWAVTYFRCYLLGRNFVAKTDHIALTYLKKFADSNPRLMRWSLKLAGFNFSVEHRPGKKIPHADALSRHVGTVLHDENLKSWTVSS